MKGTFNHMNGRYRKIKEQLSDSFQTAIETKVQVENEEKGSIVYHFDDQERLHERYHIVRLEAPANLPNRVERACNAYCLRYRGGRTGNGNASN